MKTEKGRKPQYRRVFDKNSGKYVVFQMIDYGWCEKCNKVEKMIYADETPDEYGRWECLECGEINSELQNERECNICEIQKEMNCEDVNEHLTCGNWVFSVQRHKGTYGYESGLFEIGVYEKDNFEHQIKVKGFVTLTELLELYHKFLENPEKFYWVECN